MKRRYLRPWIQTLLEIITAILFLFIVLVNDMNDRAIIFFIGALGIVALNINILGSLGRYEN